MRYKDEFHIASTAVLLSMAMFGISVVVPKESRVPTAKTTLTEAPETGPQIMYKNSKKQKRRSLSSPEKKTSHSL